LLQNQYTYKYIAQAPTSGAPEVYGSDVYGANSYSCAANDQICLAGVPGAPNTGFLVSSNPVFMGGVFITAILVITVIAYAIIRKVKQPKAQK
jgi:hypothetical protein